MVVVRDVFQAKYGRGDELVELLKQAREKMGIATRIYVDMSGPFFTVVEETEVESMADWETKSEELFQRQEFAGWFERMVPLVESGRREFYRVV